MLMDLQAYGLLAAAVVAVSFNSFTHVIYGFIYELEKFLFRS